MLTLFLVQRDADARPEYDTMMSCVVAATSPAKARAIAQQHKGDEGAAVWKDRSTTVKVVGTASPNLSEGLVCRNFVNG